MPRKKLPRLLNLFFGRPSLAAVASLVVWQAPAVSHAAVTAGGIAILGYTDNNDLFDDTFSIAALEQIMAGTEIYFTDNGWHSGDMAFLGADLIYGAGAETLIKLTFTSNVAAGTIMRSGNDAFEFAWDVSSTIPNATNGDVYSFLNLAASGGGEQIYAFEIAGTPGMPPLLNASNHLYVLDMGDFSNAGFEDADTTGKGNITPGLSLVANTAVTLPDAVPGSDLNDFHNGSFALNMADSDVVALNLAGGTKAQWLALIADSANWTKVNYESDPEGDVEAQLNTLNFAAVPEPSRALLLTCAGLMVWLRRRRTAA